MCAQVQLLDQQEITFWKKFIKKYLAPIDKDEDKEKKIADDLKVNDKPCTATCTRQTREQLTKTFQSKNCDVQLWTLFFNTTKLRAT